MAVFHQVSSWIPLPWKEGAPGHRKKICRSWSYLKIARKVNLQILFIPSNDPDSWGTKFVA